MKYYSNEQIKILKSLCKQPIDLTDIRLNPAAMQVYRYLQAEQLVAIKSDNSPVRRCFAEITPNGESYLATLKMDNVRFKHPFFISVGSFVVSVAALLLAAF